MHTQSRAQQRFYRVGRSLEFLPYSRSRCTLLAGPRARRPPRREAEPPCANKRLQMRCPDGMQCRGGRWRPSDRAIGRRDSVNALVVTQRGRPENAGVRLAITRARATGRRRAPPSRASAADQPVAAGSRPSLHHTTAGGVSEARAVRSPRTLHATTQVATLNGTSDTSGTLRDTLCAELCHVSTPTTEHTDRPHAPL